MKKALPAAATAADFATWATCDTATPGCGSDLPMVKFVNSLWHQVPTIWIDCETTGLLPGFDRACQVGFARFESGRVVVCSEWYVNPGRPIPPEATAIHGITDEMVAGSPTIADVFASDEVRALLADAQPCAYNAPFDRHFVPPFGDWTWPWLDCLSLVRVVDRFVEGTGRHKLVDTCARHGIELIGAHGALADAAAAGRLFYTLMRQRCLEHGDPSLGLLLRWQREQEASEWYRYQCWLAQQPPRGREVAP